VTKLVPSPSYFKIIWLLAAVLATTASPVRAQDKTVTCTGTLVDVWTRKNAERPLAVIYDVSGKYACTIDRTGARHDPMRPCSFGEKCRVTGIYRMLGLGEQKTYSIQAITNVDRDPNP